MASIYANRKNGKIVSFKFKACLGRDLHGKQIVKCTTWKTDSLLSEKRLISLANKEATNWEKRLVLNYEEESKKINQSDITIEDFINRVWLIHQLQDRNIRQTTEVFYEYILKVVLSYFKNKKLKSISNKHIEEYLYYLKNNYKVKRSLSQKTLRHHYSVLNSIFEYALKNNYIQQNPVKKVECPKLSKKKVDALSKEEAKTFLFEVDKLPLKYKVIYNLLLTTGLRRGECFGLMWRDVDFINNLLRVERNVTYTQKNGVNIGDPKTESGCRVIPLTSKMLSLLKEYKEEYKQNININKNMFLFYAQGDRTKPQEPTHLTKHLKSFMKKINLPDMSPHDLRHTCGSLLIQGGTDIKTVQDILGHADASTTLNFYVKSDINKMRTSTQKVFDF